MAWSDVAQNAVGGAASSAGGALVGGLFGLLSAKKNYKYNKKLMAIQNQYDVAAFEREKEAQKELSQYMATNSNLWQKMSLQNAGYSTADPNGTGVQTAGVSAPSMDTPSVPNFTGWDAVSQGAMQGALASAQIANLRADTLNKTTQNEQMKLELQNYRDTYEERVGKIKSEYYKLTKENRYLDAMVDNLAESTRGISIDNNFKEETFSKRKEKLFKEVEILISEGKIKETESKLADYGILLGASDIGNILSIAASGKGGEAAVMFAKFIGSVISALPAAVGEVVKVIWQGGIDNAKLLGSFLKSATVSVRESVENEKKGGN